MWFGLEQLKGTREGGQSKIRDRSENPTACGCMYFQIQPARARIGAPEGERAPRDLRCRAHRAFGANPFVLIVEGRGQSKILDRSEDPTACGCMHVQIQPARARVGAPEGERAPRDRRCRAHRVFRRKPFRSHCRADRRVGRLSRRSRPPPETALRA